MMNTIAKLYIALILVMVLTIGVYEIYLFWKHIILNKPIEEKKEKKGFDTRPIIVQLEEVFGKKKNG